jgi:CO/xanthine dehydrogenase Mo-binding subunit
VHDAGDEEAAGVRVGDFERLGHTAADRGREHSRRDAERIHHAEQLVDADTRAAVAEYDEAKDRLTLTLGSQGPHRIRDVLCKMILNIPVEKMRVITPDTGGGFAKTRGTGVGLGEVYDLGAP